MSQGALVSSWASSLWTASWQGLLFVAVVWAVCRILNGLPASTKAWLWWLAALKLLVGLLWVGIELPLLPSSETSPLARLNHRLDLLAPKIAGSPVAQGSVAPAARVPAAPEPEPTNWALLILPGLWAGGVIGSVTIVAAQGMKMHGLRCRANASHTSKAGSIARELGAKCGVSRRPVVLVSDEITAPMVTGLFRPAMLLPAGFEESLDEAELRLCVAHELAHIRRRDLPLALVPTLMQTAFFFFPPAWLIRREWEIEREAACDSEALAMTSSSPADYGRLLIKIVADDHRGALSPALGATASYHTLKKRISNMMHARPAPRSMRIVAATVSALGLLLAIPWQMTPRAAAQQSVVVERNVVVNGGFEETTSAGLLGWNRGSLPPGADVPVTISYNSIKDSDPERVLDMRHSGHGSVSFSKSDQTFFPVATMTQNLPYDGQKRIRVSLWAKAEQVKKFALAVIMSGAGDGKIEWGAYIGDQTGATPVNHEWKEYSKIVEIPEGTTNITLALEMYGSGTAYVDDVSATYQVPGSSDRGDGGKELDDIKGVTSEDRNVNGDPMMRYMLIGGGYSRAKTYKLLFVMPGGDGSAEFNPFVRRIWKFALPPDYLVAELVAPRWSDDQFDSIVWPTKSHRWPAMRFATEDFLDAVIRDIERSYRIDAGSIYTLGWSSGGPPSYAAPLSSSRIKGSLVAMSVFDSTQLPIANAKGHSFYLLNSPEDKIVDIGNPTRAMAELSKAGAQVKLATYTGGHGWHGDVYGNIRKGIQWLEQTR